MFKTVLVPNKPPTPQKKHQTEYVL